MFAAPPAVEARVFAKIPDRLSKVGQRSAFADVQFHGAETPRNPSEQAQKDALSKGSFTS